LLKIGTKKEVRLDCDYNWIWQKRTYKQGARSNSVEAETPEQISKQGLIWLTEKGLSWYPLS
jgi:hypothetical protein